MPPRHAKFRVCLPVSSNPARLAPHARPLLRSSSEGGRQRRRCCGCSSPAWTWHASGRSHEPHPSPWLARRARALPGDGAGSAWRWGLLLDAQGLRFAVPVAHGLVSGRDLLQQFPAEQYRRRRDPDCRHRVGPRARKRSRPRSCSSTAGSACSAGADGGHRRDGGPRRCWTTAADGLDRDAVAGFGGARIGGGAVLLHAAGTAADAAAAPRFSPRNGSTSGIERFTAPRTFPRGAVRRCSGASWARSPSRRSSSAFYLAIAHSMPIPMGFSRACGHRADFLPRADASGLDERIRRPGSDLRVLLRAAGIAAGIGPAGVVRGAALIMLFSVSGGVAYALRKAHVSASAHQSRFLDHGVRIP